MIVSSRIMMRSGSGLAGRFGGGGFKVNPGRLFTGPRFNFSTYSGLVRPGKEKLIGAWLFLTAAGVLGMIVLGGYTRLTHSGLSMADWSPYTKRYPQNDQ
jgi:hypothetical protein